MKSADRDVTWAFVYRSSDTEASREDSEDIPTHVRTTGEWDGRGGGPPLTVHGSPLADELVDLTATYETDQPPIERLDGLSFDPRHGDDTGFGSEADPEPSGRDFVPYYATAIVFSAVLLLLYRTGIVPVDSSVVTAVSLLLMTLVAVSDRLTN